LEAPAGNETNIGDLLARLAEEGRACVRAEIGLYKAIALHRAGRAKAGLVAILLAALLMNAALIALVVFIGLWIAIHLGPVIAGLIVFAGIAFVSALLAWFGAARLKALGGDAEEKAALAAGELLP
jgi:hypothetical protein